ncbi:MAG: YciI family protein [Rhodospirillales bacterium]|nr:YciI family protein [Rhodospirillales bacterium]
MLFVIYCVDRPGQEPLRLENRPAHLAFLGSYKDNVVAAGPLQSDDGNSMVGSLLIMDFPDHDAAEAFAAGDPYAAAGLFESVVIRRWKKVLPADPAG